ncbi:thiosulfate sulfurtransferase [Ventosimonas gracilis]|uniref:Thiosulfate sulfurtransferase n=1 Tax=Ventosimonas gracilis TaxID=1680762 RepID=A0A139SNY9_9GAMM|nr:rhodanese-like domain-containing protein [Ventosimonas gracilis]KXU36161.1 thiosulfate sulfurtransferase [Ventosimonas gracilis]
MLAVPDDLPLVVEPLQILPYLQAPNLIVVDLCSALRYQQGHLPGARWLDPKRTQRGTPPAPGLAPELLQLSQLFGELGHHQDAVYLVYDDEGGGWAGRFIWLLDLIGHKRMHYLNGGLPAWLDEGLPLSQELPAAHVRRAALTLCDAPSADCNYIKSRLHAEDLVIWDARSAAEYHSGHIPTAVHFEWTAGMDRERSLRIRVDISERLGALGITEDKQVITHCQTHHRSGFTYLLARSLNFPRIKAYPGSWAEWGSRADTPIES